MSSILDIMNDGMKNFDPVNDSADDFEALPDGEYNCLIEEVTAKKNDKGTNWINFKCSIIDGEYEHRFLFPNFFFSEKTAVRSGKQLQKIITGLGYDANVLEIMASASSDSIEDQLKALASSLNEMSGNQVIVEQKTGSNDYVSHKITPLV